MFLHLSFFFVCLLCFLYVYNYVDVEGEEGWKILNLFVAKQKPENSELTKLL